MVTRVSARDYTVIVIFHHGAKNLYEVAFKFKLKISRQIKKCIKIQMQLH